MTTGNLDGRRKRKCLVCIAAGVIIQTLIIVLFVVLIMRIRTPKVRLSSVSVESININPSSKSASFRIKVNAEVKVRNTNFGHYKFENSTATILYRGAEVGKTSLVKTRVRARSTKRFNVTMSFNSNKVSSDSNLGSDISSKNLSFSAYAKLEGKVHLFKIFKKKRSATMNCTFVVNTSSKTVNDLLCK
ncbi:late embryogenesis abundant protein At1g64065-like [Humulus lupulus]|uniref:late embryogenesis abundant protein At1g64065-like n=1 Tax=Humulus lupulus TaxID=3486 RepID=UPI002B41848E|nr:late embryogenesis abundant protein At1g64065-like [Humulus lupulus]